MRISTAVTVLIGRQSASVERHRRLYLQWSPVLDQHIPPSEMHGQDVVELFRLRRGVRLAGGREAERRVSRCGEHVLDTGRETVPGVGDTAGHRQGAQVVEGIGNLLVDRALTILELALDGERLLAVVADAE